MSDPLLTPMQLGRTLQSARKARKLTQAAIGTRLGLSQKRVSAMELDPGSITAEQLLKLCAVLDLELMIGSRPAPPKSPAKAPAKSGSAPKGPKIEW